jgi:hypothetical protein
MAKTINGTIDLYDSKRIKLTIKVDKEFVYIEGSTISLKFLSEILKAYSDQKFQDNFWISPTNSGNRYFLKDSTHGICFWNTDYDESKIKNKKKSKLITKNNKLEK